MAQFAHATASSSPFVAGLLRVFSREIDAGTGLVDAIVGGLPDVYAHPQLVLPGIRLAGGGCSFPFFSFFSSFSFVYR